jgi:hypothetical protein
MIGVLSAYDSVNGIGAQVTLDYFVLYIKFSLSAQKGLKLVAIKPKAGSFTKRENEKVNGELFVTCTIFQTYR